MPEKSTSIDRRDIPIPLNIPSVAGWKEIPIAPEQLGEDAYLVPLGAFSNHPRIFTDSIYSGERDNSPYRQDQNLVDPQRLPGSLTTMFVRPSVAEALEKAQALLPRNHFLIIHDAYRTLQIQGALYEKYYSELQKLHPDWTEEQLTTEAQKFVSLPSSDPAKPSPHNTGGAVDLAIIRVPDEQAQRISEIEEEIKDLPDTDLHRYDLEMEMTTIKSHGAYLYFGTPFDHGGEKASSTYFEQLAQERPLTDEENEALRNRRLLYHIMKDVGLQAYPDEWWHFNSPKSQMGAKTAGLETANFGRIALSAENLEHEKIRQQHRLGVLRIQDGWRPRHRRSFLDRALGRNKDPLGKARQAVEKSLRRDGNYAQTSLPNSEEISPQAN
ncbi:MAG: D-alanyl-D-alanine carboxypeptidase family protein [Candidatus Levybacteria bacterium]|nr:D-alanyl-D-alanine carboxypeptidase family protein [Candidatus Levybacteria bacterium]